MNKLILNGLHLNILQKGQSTIKYWYFNGDLHNTDGPAVIHPNGTKEWWISGKRHRLDGPAVINAYGTEEWWINGEKLPTKEVKKWIEDNKINLSTTEGQLAFKIKWSN